MKSIVETTVFKQFCLFLLIFASASALRPVDKSLYVVFGRPGSGKTTVATKAFESLTTIEKYHNDERKCVALDLDVCVTQLMRDNFSKGIYPTLKERKVFAEDACDYVEDELTKICRDEERITAITAIISFSFVNTDLRDVFISRFPDAEWILIDTSEDECTKRINEREGHFYKGEIPSSSTEEGEEDETDDQIDDKDNSEWKFAPVTFPHLILDGLTPIEDNASKIVQKIENDASKKQ